MELPNRFFLLACLWDMEHDTYAKVEYPPGPRTFTIWTHDDEPELHEKFVAHFKSQM